MKKRKMYKLGQMLLFIGVVMIIVNGILIWLNKLDSQINSIIFIFSLILISVGKHLSKKE